MKYTVLFGVSGFRIQKREFEQGEDASNWMQMLRKNYNEYPQDYNPGEIAYASMIYDGKVLLTQVHIYGSK